MRMAMLFTKFKLIFPYILLAFVTIFLKYQGFEERWYFHLHTDVFSYFERADYFLRNGNLQNYKINEYQLGATFFFILLSLSKLVIDFSFQNYVYTLVYVNILFILFLGYIYSKYTNSNSIYIFSLILLFTGPIILFRHELFLIVLITLSLLFWKLHKRTTSLLFLGVATITKLFPIILLPPLLIINLKKKQYLNLIKNVIFYLLGIFIPLTLYLSIFEVSISQIKAGLDFHIPKPVSSESVVAAFISLWSLIKTGQLPNSVEAYGTFGIGYENFPGPFWLYHYIWILPIGLFYLWLFNKLKMINERNFILILLSTVLLFLIFSKSMTPQYFLWFALLLPLIDVKILLRLPWFSILLFTLCILSINQYIYPLNFSGWIDMYNKGGNLDLFWINLLKITLILAIELIVILLLKKELQK